jgi:hypothetical protein
VTPEYLNKYMWMEVRQSPFEFEFFKRIVFSYPPSNKEVGVNQRIMVEMRIRKPHNSELPFVEITPWDCRPTYYLPLSSYTIKLENVDMMLFQVITTKEYVWKRFPNCVY